MKVTEFNRQNLNTLRAEIDKALATVAQKHGIAMKIGNISYNGDSFHTRLEAFVQTGSANGMTASQLKQFNNLKSYGFMYNLSEKHYGKTFMSNGETYKFVGIMPSRPKYPIIGENVRTGRQFKFTENVISQITK